MESDMNDLMEAGQSVENIGRIRVLNILVHLIEGIALGTLMGYSILLVFRLL
jgi:hypothetical protein